MQNNKIVLNNRKIEYIFRKNRLSKNIRISVRADRSVLVSVPMYVSQKRAEKFLQEKSFWILEKIDAFKEKSNERQIKTNKDDYKHKKEKARKLINDRLAVLNKYYGFKYKRVSIRNQRTRWGSCSGQKNLNFNYRLVYLEAHELDYIVVHELCHLKEMNHSSSFWELVAQTIPDYINIRKSIKNKGLELF